VLAAFITMVMSAQTTWCNNPEDSHLQLSLFLVVECYECVAQQANKYASYCQKEGFIQSRRALMLEKLD
jgi:hypothetical protein